MIRFAFLAAVALSLQACPPLPAPPDATTDGGPLLDAAPPASNCAAACTIMAALCGSPQPKSCEGTLTNVERDRLIRTPSGGSLTCACVRAATSKTALAACGASCP